MTDLAKLGVAEDLSTVHRSLDHPLGTDNIGHDTLAQMLAGGQVSLAVGFLAMLIALVLGTFIGVLA